MYGLGSILNRIVSVIMLPIYTRYLSPAQYGVLQLLDITVDVTAILFTAGIRSGLQRFYFKAQTAKERNEVVFTTFFLEMSLTIVGTVVLFATADFVQKEVLVGAGTPNLVRLAALNFSLTALTAVPMALLLIEQRAALSTILNLIKLAIQVALNIYFLVYRHLGVEAILLSNTIAMSSMGLALVVWMVGRTGIRVSRAVVRDLRRFGLPYQVTTAAAFVLTFGDRFFLARYSGTSEVGLYGLAYQFGFLLYSVSSGPFQNAWLPQRFELASRPREERDASYARGFFFYNLVLLTAAVGMIVFVRPALAILTTAEFHDAAPLVPVIVAAYLIHNWADVFKFGIDVSERTKLFTWASWIATVVVVVAYAVLIPPFGGFGAAWATLIAFVVRAGLTYYWSQRVWPVNYQLRRSAGLALIAAGASSLAFLIPAPGVPLQIALGTVLTLAYAAAVWRFVLDDDHRKGVVALLRSRRLAAITGRA